MHHCPILSALRNVLKPLSIDDPDNLDGILFCLVYYFLVSRARKPARWLDLDLYSTPSASHRKDCRAQTMTLGDKGRVYDEY